MNIDWHMEYRMPKSSQEMETTFRKNKRRQFSEASYKTPRESSMVRPIKGWQ